MPIANRRLRQDLRLVTWDGATYCWMVGSGEAYLAAFALALGMGEVVSGLVSTLPLMVGATLQLAAPWGVRKLGSARRYVALCAGLQAASLLPLALAALVGALPVWALFVVASIYWGAALGAGAAWNTWMGQIIPPSVRPNYFGRRSRLCQLVTLGALLVAGGILAIGDATGMLMIAFAAIFAMASLSRALSTNFILRQTDVPATNESERRVSPLELVGRVRHAPEARLLAYMLAVQVAVQISAPYFNPYMLVELGFGKGEYTILLATSFLGKSFALPIAGRLARRLGARAVLRAGGIGIVPLAALWLVTDSFVGLLLVQFAAGAIWAAYELATFLLMLETIREEERTSVLVTFNLANAGAIVGGSLVGGALLATVGSPDGYHLLFGVSTVLRMATVLLLMRVVSDRMDTVPIATGPLSVRPNLGSLERPILGSISAIRVESEPPSGGGSDGEHTTI